jgi:hypothetical protein
MCCLYSICIRYLHRSIRQWYEWNGPDHHDTKPITNGFVIVLYSFSKDPLILVSVLMPLCVIDTVTANSRSFRVFNMISKLYLLLKDGSKTGMCPDSVTLSRVIRTLCHHHRLVLQAEYFFQISPKLVLSHTQVALQGTGSHTACLTQPVSLLWILFPLWGMLYT